MEQPKMNRRKALKAIGLVVACGIAKVSESSGAQSLGNLTDIQWNPANYEFSEEGLNKLIITRKGGKKIEIPFSEIFDALEAE